MHFHSLWMTPHQPCVTKGLTRAEASLLHRIRSGSARTPAWLQKTRLSATLLYPAGKTCGDIEHYMLKCSEREKDCQYFFEALQLAALQSKWYPVSAWSLDIQERAVAATFEVFKLYRLVYDW